MAFYLSWTKFCPVFLGFTGLYWVFLDLAVLSLFLLGFTGFLLRFTGFTGCYQVFYWVLLDVTRFYWVLFGFPWFLLAIYSFYWDTPDFYRFCHAMTSQSGALHWWRHQSKTKRFFFVCSGASFQLVLRSVVLDYPFLWGTSFVIFFLYYYDDRW